MRRANLSILAHTTDNKTKLNAKMCTVLFIRTQGVFGTRWVSLCPTTRTHTRTQMRINTHGKDAVKELTVSTFIFHWINKPVKGKHEPHLQKITAWGSCIHEVKTSKKLIWYQIQPIYIKFLLDMQKKQMIINKKGLFFFFHWQCDTIHKHPQSALHLQQICLTKTCSYKAGFAFV